MIFEMAAAQANEPFGYQSTGFEYPFAFQPVVYGQPLSQPTLPAQVQTLDVGQLAFELGWRYVDPAGLAAFKLGGMLAQSANPVVSGAGSLLSLLAFLHSLDELGKKLDD